MKSLNFNGEKLQAEKIVKTVVDIIGYDSKGKETFSFKGISDFTQFTLDDGQTFDTAEPTISELKIQLAATQEAVDFLIMGGTI